jgi:hypothetical protein
VASEEQGARSKEQGARREQKIEVRGQKSEVRGQKNKLNIERTHPGKGGEVCAIAGAAKR